MARSKTLKQTLSEVQELKQRSAVYEAAANWLQTRYVSRDSTPAVSQVSCEGAPVPEAVVEDVITELREQASEMADSADSMLGMEVSGG